MAILVVSQWLFWSYAFQLSLHHLRVGELYYSADQKQLAVSVDYTLIVASSDIVILVIFACSLVVFAMIVMVANLCFSCKVVDPSM